MREHYRDLADQLAAMPGGVARLRADYFATVTVAEAAAPDALEAWTLAAGGLLALVRAGEGTRLVWRRETGEDAILDYPPGLDEAAEGYAVPPLGLALLVQAMGTVDDDRRLRRLLPEVDKAAKGLLLIATCRLCG